MAMKCFLCKNAIEPFTDFCTMYGAPEEGEGWDIPEYAHLECQVQMESSSFSLTKKGIKIAEKRKKERQQ